jgi:hypothetical protein
MKTKKMILSIVIVLVLSMSSPVFAFLHEDDNFQYGSIWHLIPWDQWSQYSKFYCPEQYHHATARIKGRDLIMHEVKTYAGGGVWANAETGCEYDPVEWNSYYG